VKNLDEPNLWPLLSAALLLLGERARIHMDSRREDYEPGADATGEHETVRRDGVAAVHAVADLVQDLPRLLEQRARVQALRRRPDDEIFELFRRPFLPLGPDALSFLEAVATLTETLGLERLFERRRATHLVVLDAGGRSRELARTLGRHLRVTLASGVELRGLVAESDVLVLDPDALRRHRFLESARAVKVVDVGNGPPALDDASLDAGDLLVCRSEAQRETWLAALAARRPELGEEALRRLVAVVPSADAVEPIVAVCEEPWRWTSLRTRRRPQTLPTEDVQLLLGRRRADAPRPAPGGESLAGGIARTLWRRTPEGLRTRLRPALRRAQARRAR
jgi:hypothetical protein